MEIDISKLRGRHIYLELLLPEHREYLRPLAKDDRIWEFTKTLLVDERFDNMFDSYFDVAMDPAAMGGQFTFVIRKIDDDSILGMTRLYEIDQKDKKAMIGHTWYSPSAWGKVYNKECKLLLLQYIFEILQFNRAELRAAGQNIRSQRAIAKIGGVKEGTIRKHGYRNDGSLKDLVIFGIIDDEWPCVKEKLCRLVADSENV